MNHGKNKLLFFVPVGIIVAALVVFGGFRIAEAARQERVYQSELRAEMNLSEEEKEARNLQLKLEEIEKILLAADFADEEEKEAYRKLLLEQYGIQ